MKESDPEFLALRRALLRKLGRQALHSAQVEKWLEGKQVAQNIRQKLVGECREKGWIDDTAYLEELIASYQRKGKGSKAVLEMCRKKGICVSWEFLKAAYSQEDSRKAIRQFLDKRGKAMDLQEGKNRHKVFQALLRRGFDPEEIAFEIHEVMALPESNS